MTRTRVAIDLSAAPIRLALYRELTVMAEALRRLGYAYDRGEAGRPEVLAELDTLPVRASSLRAGLSVTEVGPYPSGPGQGQEQAGNAP